MRLALIEGELIAPRRRQAQREKRPPRGLKYDFALLAKGRKLRRTGYLLGFAGPHYCCTPSSSRTTRNVANVILLCLSIRLAAYGFDLAAGF